MTAIHFVHGRAASRQLARRDAVDALTDATHWAYATVREWQRRIRERDQLAHLDDRMLADIGITQADQAFLANKPFWRE